MKLITKFLLILFLLLATSYQQPATTYAAIPHLINYQGKLTNAQGQPITGTVAVTFRIYDQESGGAPLWEEPYTSLTVDKGIFNVMLGGVTALNLAFDKQYYLGIQVGSDTEMAPRQRLTSAGYAFSAENGVPKGAIIMWSGSITNIPSGWALCDGTNGTPDLRNKFIAGAGSSYTVGTTGGTATHTHSAGSLAASAYTGNYHVARNDYQNVAVAKNDHTHNITGATDSNSSLPPYYALAYIIKL